MKKDSRWGSHVGGAFHQYRYFLCNREAFTPRTNQDVLELSGRWTLDTDRGIVKLYVTCPQCGRSNNLSDRNFRESGAIHWECVVCDGPKCGTHFFPKLVGWSDVLSDKINRAVVVRRKAKARS
jgi:hypothetical protein